MGEWKTCDWGEGGEVGEPGSADYGDLDGSCLGEMMLVMMIALLEVGKGKLIAVANMYANARQLGR